MSAAQREKGARGELEVAAIWRAAGFDCNRVPNSGGLRIKGDLYGDLPAHVESKWQAVLRLPEWWRQTRNEAPAGVLPVLAVRLTGSRHQPKEWVAVVPLEDLVALLAELGLQGPFQRAPAPSGSASAAADERGTRAFPHDFEGSGKRCLACGEPRWMHPSGSVVRFDHAAADEPGEPA